MALKSSRFTLGGNVFNFLFLVNFAALASIGVVNEKLHEMLLWAIRYEKVAAVRAEACSAVATLGITDSQLVSVLQDRIVVETDEFVKW